MSLEEYAIKRIESLESENNYLKGVWEKEKERENYWICEYNKEKEKYDKLKQEIEGLAESNSTIYRYTTGEIAFVEAKLTGKYTPIAISILDERCKFLKEKKNENEESEVQD